ncbi:hypothetical protein FGG08_004364 [Glutinoglossum americanum]|uniref:Uncharacterized protein n=1 Tax=Glutinoglossum americanum TaxID=1670608 RepID=A0A9P8I0R8_9PEZI|nr:hypothetical protein FGG08_004364 [Glutinoglossum americanum]
MEVLQPDDRVEVGSVMPVASGVAGGEDNKAYGLRHECVDPEVERRVVRKLDRRLVPLLAVLYLLSVLDRSNIGNARIAGMSAYLHLSGSRYDWLLTLFYISYITFEWFALMWKVVPAHIWAACTVLAWGTVATLQSTTTSFAGEAACRFLLGMAEAGFGPGIPYLLSFFYMRRELGFRIGMFLAAAPLANSFAGGLAYFMAPVAFFFLPDSPEKAKFLTVEEKAIARARSVRQVGEGERVGSIDWRQVKGALCDVKVGENPKIVIFTSWLADRTQQRGLTIMILATTGGVGYILLATAKHVGLRYFGVFLAAAGIFPAIANILPWVLNNQGSDTKRGAGIAILNMVGQCGPLLGTRMYPIKDGPRYRKGQFLCAAFMFFTAFLALGLRTLLSQGNRKFDRKYGTVEAQASSAEAARTEEKGEIEWAMIGVEDGGPAYRYVL